MCTLTFVPHSNETIITSNRDEHISRAKTNFPVTQERKNLKLVFPQDPLAGGSWISGSSNGQVAVLLNGAFEKHKHRPPYKLSRGIILLDSLTHDSLFDYANNFDFDKVEPFTLVNFNSLKKEITELRWDEESTHLKSLDYSKPHIWSSASLYSKEIRANRKKWFDVHLNQEPINPNKMLEFHQFGGGKDLINGISMDRGNGLQTISISQIVMSNNENIFKYDNLYTQEIKKTIF